MISFSVPCLSRCYHQDQGRHLRHRPNNNNSDDLTPLQRSMRRARQRRALSSPRLLLAAASACCVLATIAVYCVQCISESSHNTYTTLSYYPSSSSSSKNKKYAKSKKRSYAVFGWSEELAEEEEEQEERFYSSSVSWMSSKIVYEAHSSAKYSSLRSDNSSSSSDNRNSSDSSTQNDPSFSSSSSSSSLTSVELQNPSFYGWTPSCYPNPLTDPVRCSIAYLSVSEALNTGYDSSSYYYNHDDDSNSSKSSNEEMIISSLPSYIPQQPQQQQQQPPVRLCDPDWVLGTEYLEEIEIALANFSQVFGQPDWQSRIKSTSSNKDQKRNGHAHRNLHHRQSSSSSQVSSSLSALHPPPPSQLSPQPELVPATVELAVATVRKINLAAVLREGSYYAYEDEEDMVNDAAQIFARSLHDLWYDSPPPQQQPQPSRGGGGGAPAAPPQPNSNYNNDENNDEREREREHNNGGVGGNTPPAPQSFTSSSSSYYEYHHNGILIFLSIQDRVCFISTGSALAAVLPWWRLDHIVGAMKPDLQHREYGTAVLRAIENVARMLEAGPPTLRDRLGDFVSRFGVVIAFAAFTFFFGAWGEYRDRRKRWQYAEQRSKLTDVERDKARQLQREYRTRSCPICLESFEYNNSSNSNDSTCSESSSFSCSSSSQSTPKAIVTNSETSAATGSEEDRLVKRSPESPPFLKLKRVDSFGIPLKGADGKGLKLLRCGHIFCESCWKSWVHSGYGNPCNCPVCRQDVGRTPRKRGTASTSSSSSRNNSNDNNNNSTHTAAYDGAPPPEEERYDPEYATDDNDSNRVHDDDNSSSYDEEEEVEEATTREQQQSSCLPPESSSTLPMIRGSSLTHPSYDAVRRTRRLSPPGILAGAARYHSSFLFSPSSSFMMGTPVVVAETASRSTTENRNHSESAPLLGGSSYSATCSTTNPSAGRAWD